MPDRRQRAQESVGHQGRQDEGEASIQGDKIRVTGKSRDDLQETIAMLRQLKGLEVALQFNRFRD